MRLTVVGLSTRETEGVGFEPTVGFPTLDFESSALNRTQPPFPVADTLDLILRCAILRCGSEVHLATEVRLTASQARSIPNIRAAKSPKNVTILGLQSIC